MVGSNPNAYPINSIKSWFERERERISYSFQKSVLCWVNMKWAMSSMLRAYRTRVKFGSFSVSFSIEIETIMSDKRYPKL